MKNGSPLTLVHDKHPIVTPFMQKTLATDGPMNISEARNHKESQKINEWKEERVYEDSNPFAFNENQRSGYAWLKSEDSFFIAPVPTHGVLPPGYYTVCESMQGYYLKQKHIAIDELYLLPDPALETIAADIIQFWGKKADYAKFKVTYKRAILMHGKQGNGKTSVINFLIKKLVDDFKGYIFDYGYGAEEMARKVRAMHPEAHIMIIMEEVDTLMNYDGHRVLNFLDGTNSIPDVVTLGTTNYLDRLEPRIINRPSRFDRVIEIPVPSPEVRRFFLDKKLAPLSAEERSAFPMEQWVQETDGLTLSHLKELIVSVFVLGKKYEEVLQIMKAMNRD